MGCCASNSRHANENGRKNKSIGELVVFVPGFRIPINVDLTQLLDERLQKSLVNRLSDHRTRIVSMAMEVANMMKTRQKAIAQNGILTLLDFLQALEEYLPVLLGLANDGSQLIDRVQFVWLNQEDDAEQTAIANAWYEVLSVLHLMAITCLAEANYLLLPKSSNEVHQQRLSEVAENRRRSIDVLLKAAGYLDCCIHQVLPQVPAQLRRNLPLDLSEGVLHALCMQALGQGVDIQLGMAINSPKATFAVKRRLACEMVKYWHQAHDSILKIPFSGGWGEKHQLYVKWKYAESKAAAYYYHGLILDEGNTEKSHGLALASLRASEEFLKESKRAGEAFNSATPTSRNPLAWGSAKYLSDKISKDASNKAHTNQPPYSQERIIQATPALPDFALSLKPDEYQLPSLDPIWNTVKTINENLLCK